MPNEFKLQFMHTGQRTGKQTPRMLCLVADYGVCCREGFGFRV